MQDGAGLVSESRGRGHGHNNSVSEEQCDIIGRRMEI